MKKMRKSFILLLSLVMMLAFALPVSAAGINLSSIKTMRVAKASTTIFTNGEAQTISVSGTYTESNSELVALTASSSNRGIAYVDEPVIEKKAGAFTATYKIKAVGNGRAVITFADKYNSKRVARFVIISKTYTEGIELTNSCVKYDEESKAYTLEVAKGGTVNLGAVVSNSNASDKVLKYKSSNPGIVVAANGNVIGRTVVSSPADVTITSRDGNSTKTVKVTVCENTKSGKITFAKELTTAAQEAGKLNRANVLCLTSNLSSKTRNYQLVATNSSYKIADLVFKSSNANVVKVDANGKITALNAGTARITATPKLGQRASATITVKVTTDPEVINMTASKNTVLANGRDIAKISATPNAGVNARLVKYEVYKNGSTTRDAVVAGGNFRTRVAGEYVVKAKVGDVESSMTIKAITPTTQLTIAGDKVITFKRTADEEYSKALKVSSNGTMTDVAWTSSNPKVATVDVDGKVVAVGNGTARITAKAVDGSNKVAFVTVKVTTDAYAISSKAVEDAEIDDNAYVLYVDGVNGKAVVNLAKKIAAFTNASASNKTVTYWSSGKRVANVIVTPTTPVAVTAKTFTGAEMKVVLKFVDREDAAMKYDVAFDSTDDIEILSGDTAYVSATVVATEADKIVTTNTKNVVYKSSNAAVATVDATGKIIARNPGEAVISASFVNPENTTTTTTENVKVYVGVKDSVIKAALDNVFTTTIRTENRDWTGIKAIFNAVKSNFEFQVLNPKQDLATLEETGLTEASVKSLLALEAKGIKIMSIDVEDADGNVYTINRDEALNNLHGELKSIIESAIGSDSVLEKWVGTNYTLTITTCDTKYADRTGLNHKISYDATVTLTDARQQELVDVDITSAITGIRAAGISKIDYDNSSRKAVVYINDADMTIDEFDGNRSIFDENLAEAFANVAKVEYTVSVAGKNFTKTESDEDGNKPVDVVNSLFDLYKEKLASLDINTLEGLDGAIAVAKVTFKVGNATYARTYEVKVVMDEATFEDAADAAIETVVPASNDYGTFDFEADTNTAKVVVNAASANITPIELDKAYFDDLNRKLVDAGKVDISQETIIVLGDTTYVVTGDDYKASIIMDLLAKAKIAKLADLDGKVATVRVPVKIGSTTMYVTYTIEFSAEKPSTDTKATQDTTEIVTDEADTIEEAEDVVEEVIEDVEETEEIIEEETDTTEEVEETIEE